MSVEPLVENWYGGEHAFRLTMDGIEAVEEISDSAIGDVLYRLSMGLQRGNSAMSQARSKEIKAIIRLGLIGGGMERVEAERKAQSAMEGANWADLGLLAYGILGNTMFPRKHDPVGKTAAAENPPGSSSRKSTAGRRPRASASPK